MKEFSKEALDGLIERVRVLNPSAVDYPRFLIKEDGKLLLVNYAYYMQHINSKKQEVIGGV
jgi:hypothetical protein